MMKKIGFVGLGAIGLPMATNLVKAGFEVRGYDVRREAVSTFAAAGGLSAASAEEAASEADVLILMVVNAAQAEAVLFDAGAAVALPDGGVVALMSTCPPGAVASLAARVGEVGRDFVDAPVSGGVSGARAATLTIMAAAPAALFDLVRPAFEALGDKLFHVGDRPGQGAAIKTVNQLLCGVHIAAAAEALALASRMGVDPAVALRILGGSSAASWMLNDRGPRMLEPEPGGDQRHRHLRQGPRHRHGGGTRGEGCASDRGSRASAVPRNIRTWRRRGRRQPGDPHLPRDNPPGLSAAAGRLSRDRTADGTRSRPS
jgi:putative dehydrogenase